MTGRGRHRALISAAILSLLALGAAPQSPTLEAPPFTIHAPADLAAEAASLAAILPGTLDRIQRALQAPPLPASSLYLIAGNATDDGLPAELGDAMPEWAAGIAIVSTRTAVIRIDRIGPYGQRRLENVLTHELAHLVMAEAAGAGRDAMPRWFREGVAGHIAHDGEWLDFLHLWLSPAASSRHPLAIIEASFEQADSETARRAAYAGSFAFIGHVVQNHTEAALARTLRGLSEGLDFEQAWARATAASLRKEEADWSAGTRGLRRWTAVLTSSVTLWGVITALFLLAGAARRVRTRRLMKEWDRLEPPDLEGDPH